MPISRNVSDSISQRSSAAILAELETIDASINSTLTTINTNQTNPYNHDAWGRPKAVLDFSIFHGLFTYSVPNRVWEENSYNGTTHTPIASTGTNCNSTDHMLVVDSGTTSGSGNALFSKRHPRYQPNRGHLFSTAVILPTATVSGTRRFGLCKNGNGVYFQLEGNGSTWTMYAVRKTGSTEELKQDITSLLPAGFDPEKGHVYDIQYQWRGVGNYKFFVDLEETYVEGLLGTRTDLSLQMPALPVCFESVAGTTTNIQVKVGCVDVTSEGGKIEGREFTSISTGTTFVNCNSTGAAMIAVKMPRTVLYNSVTVENTRDMIATKISSWCRDEAAVQVYFARDISVTNLDGLTWTAHSDGTDEFLVGGAGSALDVAFQLDRAAMQLVLTEWNDLEQKNTVINPAGENAPFYMTPGDILVVVLQSFAGTDAASSTLYYSEEI